MAREGVHPMLGAMPKLRKQILALSCAKERCLNIQCLVSEIFLPGEKRWHSEPGGKALGTEAALSEARGNRCEANAASVPHNG